MSKTIKKDPAVDLKTMPKKPSIIKPGKRYEDMKNKVFGLLKKK
jgi:hypothetical protein